MKSRMVAIAWIVVALVFVVLLLVEYSKWTSLATEVVRARAERQQLTGEIQLREQQLVGEMRKHSELLQEMQWTSSGADPSTFLTRMADLAKEKRMKVLGIGPLEKQSSAQFTKSWHTIQVQAPYREIRELTSRVERDKGIVEDVHLEEAPPTPGQPAGPRSGPTTQDEVQARFKMTALELSPQAKVIIERALAASGGAGQVPPGSPLALSVPTGTAPGSIGRDPFTFLTSPSAARPPAAEPAASTEPPPPAPPAVPIDLKGIVSFPDGYLAIVNNQIVKAGDTVSGLRVERITENAVTFREPTGGPRTVSLPELAPPAPAEPRR
jgi:hypothetical protein